MGFKVAPGTVEKASRSAESKHADQNSDEEDLEEDDDIINLMQANQNNKYKGFGEKNEKKLCYNGVSRQITLDGQLPRTKKQKEESNT